MMKQQESSKTTLIRLIGFNGPIMSSNKFYFPLCAEKHEIIINNGTSVQTVYKVLSKLKFNLSFLPVC